MPSYFDPLVGYTPAGNMPSYYNPYQNFGGITGRGGQPAQGGPQTQPGQQAGQAIVPGKDTATSGKVGRKIRIQHPTTHEVREVDARHAQYYTAKGGRIV